ncbi:MAG: tRNA-modifying protein YgfZ [Verrucomicrobiota bacterium]|nr:tRNA-modifying protein YgfZ [Verrucomicrobiota bacterium]
MIYYLPDNDLKNASAVLRIRGPDANSYLQGQFTQDVNAQNGRSYGLWLDQKGRVLADGHVLRQADRDFLVVSFSLPAAQLLARLEAYLIADEVELADETGAWTGILLWGEEASTRPLPAGVLGFPSRRAGAGSVQWLMPANRLEAVVAELNKISAEARDPRTAELERLRQGVPAVPADIGPRDLPNEGGLDDVAISYTKGCYLGQEVMARLKNLGQVRRRLHLVRGKGAPPAPGTALHQGGNQVGELRSAVSDGEGFLAMAMLSLIKLDENSPLSVAPGDPAVIRILRRV